MGGPEVSSVVEGVDLLTLSTAAGAYQCYRVKDGNIEFRRECLLNGVVWLPRTFSSMLSSEP
jgi:hypothetical protein